MHRKWRPLWRKDACPIVPRRMAARTRLHVASMRIPGLTPRQAFRRFWRRMRWSGMRRKTALRLTLMAYAPAGGAVDGIDTASTAFSMLGVGSRESKGHDRPPGLVEPIATNTREIDALVRAYAAMPERRESACACGSGRAYRRCCYASDREAAKRRIIALLEATTEVRRRLSAEEGPVPVSILQEDVPIVHALDTFAPLLIAGPHPSVLNALRSLLLTRTPAIYRDAVERALWTYAAPRGAAVGTLPSFEEANARARALYDLGIVPIALREGGLYPYGTRIRETGERPPTPIEVEETDYRHGIAAVLGTPLPTGGYVLGIDIDKGPTELSDLDHALFVERGTAPGKHHIVLASVNQLDGFINIYYKRDVEHGRPRKGAKPIVELKGAGLALRGWPALPADKPQGYTPLYIAPRPLPPREGWTAERIAEDIATSLSAQLQEECVAVRRTRRGEALPLPEAVSGALVERILAKLDEMGVRLGNPTSAGDQIGTCPFHEDRNPSFSVNVEKAVWQCFAGCGAGGLRSLAIRLGLPVPPRANPGGLTLRPEDAFEDDEAPEEFELEAKPDPLEGIPQPSPWSERGLGEVKGGVGLAGSRQSENAGRRKGAKRGVRAPSSLDFFDFAEGTAKNAALFTTGDRSDAVSAFPPEVIEAWEPLSPLATPRHLYPQTYMPSKSAMTPLLRFALSRQAMKPDEREKRIHDFELCGALAADGCASGHLNKGRKHWFCKLPFHDCASRQSWRIGRIRLKGGHRYVQHYFVAPLNREADTSGVHQETWQDALARGIDGFGDLTGKANGWKLSKGKILARSVHGNIGPNDVWLVLRIVLQEDEPGELDRTVRRIKDALGKLFDLQPGREALHAWVESNLEDDVVEWLMDMSNNHLLAVRGESPQAFNDWLTVTRGKHLFQSYGLVADLIEQAGAEEEAEKEEAPPVVCETCGKETKLVLIREEADGSIVILRRPSFLPSAFRGGGGKKGEAHRKAKEEMERRLTQMHEATAQSREARAENEEALPF